MNTIKKISTIILSLALIFGPMGSNTALAATAPDLGDAESFAVLGATTVTNTGASVLDGDLGLYAGTSITGFFGTTENDGPGIVSVGYAVHQTDATAQSAQAAATDAYDSMASQSCDSDLSGQNLGGKTLVPGVYCFTSTAQLTGTLTLDAQGDPNSVWIFQVGTALTMYRFR
jgi:type VI secretion system secreted protein VgrG